MSSKGLTRGAAACVLLAAGWISEAGAADDAPAAPPAVETFFNLEDMDTPIMSPDGTAVAILVRNQAGRRQLAVMETGDLTRVKVVAGYTDADIWGVHWVDDRRLVYQQYDEAASADEQHGKGTGLFAINRDGTDPRILVFRRGTAEETGTMIKTHSLPAQGWRFGSTLRDGSGDIIVQRYLLTTPLGQKWREVTGIVPVRLDTRTGNLHDAYPGKMPDHAMDWLIDDQGRPRAAETDFQDRSAIMVPTADGWVERANFPAYGKSTDSFSLSSIGPDGALYVARVAADEAGSRALYRFDAETGKVETEPTMRAKGFDAEPTLVIDRRQHKLLGIHYHADAPGTAWFDPAMKEIQAKVDARITGLINVLDPADCGCAKQILVTSSSDRQPSLYFLYDPAADRLVQIGGARPKIDPRQMGQTSFVRITARDGHDIPVYVTKPRSKGPWPTVVLVHGGPFLRGWDWQWDPESQFLASRGYLVVKPEFRGSQGYGERLFQSGIKQWGLTMQDDIADATTWAAKQGLSDPRRTCIAGASYGGYATLMGLVRYPELYRCGVAWAAVTDLNMMRDIQWSDAGNDWRVYGMAAMIGDPTTDAAQLVATSPLQQAAKITRPLLLAHGGVDARVPIEHATKMLGALQAAHAPVTWIEYKDEAHGWYKPETRADFYRRMETFLAANIGAAAP